MTLLQVPLLLECILMHQWHCCSAGSAVAAAAVLLLLQQPVCFDKLVCYAHVASWQLQAMVCRPSPQA
jgi:hypothetical protein